MGLDAVKFFPAVPSGGLSMIKALAAPYHTMRFMPTGGVTPQNLTEFLDYPKILALRRNLDGKTGTACHRQF